MPPPYRCHLFVCTNDRGPGHRKGSCAEKGAEAVRDAFKKKLADRGLSGEVRANSAGCLDACEAGVTLVLYPDGVWYGKVTLADVDEIIESHIVQGRPLVRLLMGELPRS